MCLFICYYITHDPSLLTHTVVVSANISFNHRAGALIVDRLNKRAPFRPYASIRIYLASVLWSCVRCLLKYVCHEIENKKRVRVDSSRYVDIEYTIVWRTNVHVFGSRKGNGARVGFSERRLTLTSWYGGAMKLLHSLYYDGITYHFDGWFFYVGFMCAWSCRPHSQLSNPAVHTVKSMTNRFFILIWHITPPAHHYYATHISHYLML